MNKANDLTASFFSHYIQLLWVPDVCKNRINLFVDGRTEKPAIFRSTDQWFASVEGVRVAALAAIETVSTHVFE